MANGKPNNVGEALFGAAGNALNFMASNWMQSQQQKKDNALTAYMTSMKAAENERAVLQHDMMMRQAQQNFLMSQLKLKDATEQATDPIGYQKKYEIDPAIAAANTVQGTLPEGMYASPKFGNVDVTTQKQIGMPEGSPGVDWGNVDVLAQQAKTRGLELGGINAEGRPTFRQPPVSATADGGLTDKDILTAYNNALENVMLGQAAPPHLATFAAYKKWILSGEGSVSGGEEIDEDEEFLRSEGF